MSPEYGIRYVTSGRVVPAADRSGARTGLIAPPVPVELVRRTLTGWEPASESDLQLPSSDDDHVGEDV